MLMWSRLMSVGVLLVLAACTPETDPIPEAEPTKPPAPAPAQLPALGLTDLSLTCERHHERSAEGTLRGRVVGLTSTAPHTINVVQGTDATLGSKALSPPDAAGAVAFAVPVTRVQTAQPVRVVLRQSGVRSLSAMAMVTPDGSTCTRRQVPNALA
jgi:hypothetical protein